MRSTMTIFDTIRYPVSDPPTVEELDNIPIEIMELWKTKYRFTTHSNVMIVAFVELFATPGEQEILALRKMIKEYDDDL